MKNIKNYILVVLLICIISGANAQEKIRINPADRLDAKTLLINPAILPYQNLAFNFGMKIFQYGFLANDKTGIRYSYSTNSYPNFLFDGLGIGLIAQSYNTPYHSESGLGFSMGYLFGDIFSFGVAARANNMSFNSDAFDLVHFGDPVFANGTGQWNLSIDAGIMVCPSENFSIGFSCNNFNQPDLSLVNEGANLPMELNFGGKYSFSIFAMQFFGNYQNEKIDVGALAEMNLFNKVLIRAGHVEESITFESQFNLYKGLALNYRIDYPLYEVNSYSSGSHQVGLSWNLKYNPMYAFNVHASVDTVRVMTEKNIIRLRREVANDSILSMIDWKDLTFSDEGIIFGREAENAGLPLDEMESESLPHNKYLEVYGDNFKDLHDHVMKKGNRLKVDICFDDAVTAERAMILKNYLIDSLLFQRNDIRFYQEVNEKSDSLKKAEQDSLDEMLLYADTTFFQSQYMDISSPPKETMIPDTIYFTLSNIRTRRVSQWRILITDFLGNRIHEIPGYHNIEEIVPWDGFTDQGNLLDVGNYYYVFQYRKGDKRWIPKKPKRKRITFIRVKRSNMIELTRQDLEKLDRLKRIVIRLKNPIDIMQRLNQ